MDEQHIPIDIHGQKLLTWLVSRREVKKDWSSKVHIIRQKINNAIQDMPEHPEVTKLLSGTYINYFHCLKIIEILKETEKDSKNIFGWYGSQRMKDWQEIVNLYERDSVYLAEAAQLLIRSIKFEIPDVKQRISEQEKKLVGCSFQEEKLKKSIEDAEKKFGLLCKRVGIPGEKVKKELQMLLKELPDELGKIAENTKNLQEARQVYLDFLTFTMKKECECLPLLKFLMEHGNVTTYEWIHGEAPSSVEEQELKIYVESEDEKEDNDEIDFGEEETIDFGDADVELTTGDIDWGGAEQEGETIDWDITDAEVPTVDIVVEDSGMSGGVAKGTEAMSLLYNPETRTQLMNECYELLGFLNQRKNELSGSESIITMHQFTSASSSIQEQSVDQMEAQISEVKKLVNSLSSSKMMHQFLIQASPKYVDRIDASFRSQRQVLNKLKADLEQEQNKRDSVKNQDRELPEKLALLIKKTKELKVHIEKHISKRYKNRPVNLIALNI